MGIKFNSLLYKTNRFHVAMGLFSNRSQKTSKCGKNISDTTGNPGSLCHVGIKILRTYEAKFRSENLLENGNKNR